MMADSLELILQVCPVLGDDVGALAEWLRAELLDLDLQEVGRLPGGATPLGAKGSADVPGLLLVQLNPSGLRIVLAKVTDWVARSDRMVEISAGGHTLKVRRPAHKQQDGAIDGSPVPAIEVTGALPGVEIEAVIEAIPPFVPDRDSSAQGPGKVLVPLRARESMLAIRRSPGGQGELSGRNRLADASLIVKGSINIEALPQQESRRTASLAVISSLLGGSLVILLSIVILTLARHYHGFSISANYPIHRVYHGIMRYFVRITPPPGSSHMLLVYSIYLAVLPVLFAVVFMHLRVGSTRLVIAAVACVIFMAAPFVIAITSIRVDSTNCGSWDYPGLNTGPECYSALTGAFRIAFAAGIVGLAVPVIYLIRGRRDGHDHNLLRVLILCANIVIRAFIFVSNLARRQARYNRDTAADKKEESGVDQYLLPHERQVITVRRHPAVLIGPSVLALDGLLAASVLTAVILHGNAPLIAAVWITWLILLARMIWKAVDWATGFFAVTSQRLLLVRGVLTRKVAMLPLSKVTDMSFHRSLTGRLLGFGEFIIEPAGPSQALQTVDYIPYPEQLYLEVCGLIFREDEPEKPESDDS